MRYLNRYSVVFIDNTLASIHNLSALEYALLVCVKTKAPAKIYKNKQLIGIFDELSLSLRRIS